MAGLVGGEACENNVISQPAPLLLVTVKEEAIVRRESGRTKMADGRQLRGRRGRR
jgi:hypothetical protein